VRLLWGLCEYEAPRRRWRSAVKAAAFSEAQGKPDPHPNKRGRDSRPLFHKICGIELGLVGR